MTEPLVSVKMLTYNHAPYIAQAIEGVLMQKTTFPFELVIGEDCSTDGTREIVFDYARRYPEIIRVITSDKNVGAAQNSARCNAALRGKYIAWCEGDDYWHRDDKLQIQVDYLEAHPECGLVYSDYDQKNESSGQIIRCYRRHRKKPMTSNPTIEDIVAGRALILTCTVLARKQLVFDIYQSDPFLFSSHFLMGDTQLWAEIAVRSKIFYIPESLAVHRHIEESATRSKNPARRLRFLVSNAEMLVYLCQKHNLDDTIKRTHQICWQRNGLKLAFLTKDAAMADHIKQRCHIPLKHKLWYWGAHYSAARPFIWVIMKLFRRL